MDVEGLDALIGRDGEELAALVGRDNEGFDALVGRDGEDAGETVIADWDFELTWLWHLDNR